MGSRIRSFIGLLGLMVGVASGCGAARTFDYKKAPDPRVGEYVVGPADELRVNVWRDEALSLQIRVRPDGTITMPLIGDVRAAGRTPTQIRKEISEKLARFVKSDAAEVTVAVITVGSYRFTVSGNVERPGLYASPYYVTVIEAVAMAGGPNRFSAPQDALIVRSVKSGNVERIPIDYDRLKTGEWPDQNIVILAGDTIFIP